MFVMVNSSIVFFGIEDFCFCFGKRLIFVLACAELVKWFSITISTFSYAVFFFFSF